MRFREPESKRLSCQATKSVPSGATSAEGNGGARIENTSAVVKLDTWTLGVKIAPPSVDVDASTSSDSVGPRSPLTSYTTTSEPSGRGRGWAPFASRPAATWIEVVTGALHVRPPSALVCVTI